MIDFPRDDSNAGFTVRGRYFPDTSDVERQRADEREGRDQARTTAWIAAQLAGVGFRTLTQMTTWACAVAVEAMGRALTAEEHRRFTVATRELWNAAHPAVVYEITTLGREALAVAECVDCFSDAEPDSMCARCRARHVRPDRSDVRVTGAA